MARRRSDTVFPVVGERFCRASEERQLTVQKTSLFSHGDGFAVYEHHRWSPEGEPEEIGELIFRVDSYAYNSHLVLMGSHGETILTVRKKWPSLHQRWEGFLGEKAEGQKPLFSARRHSIVGNSVAVLVEVYGSNDENGGMHEYRVEGSFAQRCCTVYDALSKEDSGGGGGGEEDAAAVAEIRRKCAASPSCDSVVLGRDVFCLRLAPGLDAAFFMGLVLVLDRIAGDDG